MTKLVFLEKGAILLSAFTGSGDCCVVSRWDTALGEFREAVQAPGKGYSIATSRDNKHSLYCVGFPRTVAKLWDVPSNTERAALNAGADLPNINDAAFSPDGKVIALVGGTFKQGVIDFWSGERFDQKKSWHALGGGILSVGFSPKGDVIAYGSTPQFDGTSLRGGLELREFPGGNSLPLKLHRRISYFDFMPDGQHLAVGLLDHIAIYDARTGKSVARSRTPTIDSSSCWPSRRTARAWPAATIPETCSFGRFRASTNRAHPSTAHPRRVSILRLGLSFS
ncbi:MAG: hypothetical protein L0Y71_15565 [Gemmataceae bacterium]|nr:hypothetical protein [Gemmataceae bacterium]